MISFDYKGIATQEMLDSIAENMYAAKSYIGYEGSFQASDPDRNGMYFVKSVVTSCGSSGITRKITLGKKL